MIRHRLDYLWGRDGFRSASSFISKEPAQLQRGIEPVASGYLPDDHQIPVVALTVPTIVAFGVEPT